MGNFTFLGATIEPAHMTKLDELAALAGTSRSEALRALLDAPLGTLALLTSFSSGGQKETAVLFAAGRAAALRATITGANSDSQNHFITSDR